MINGTKHTSTKIARPWIRNRLWVYVVVASILVVLSYTQVTHARNVDSLVGASIGEDEFSGYTRINFRSLGEYSRKIPKDLGQAIPVIIKKLHQPSQWIRVCDTLSVGATTTHDSSESDFPEKIVTIPEGEMLEEEWETQEQAYQESVDGQNSFFDRFTSEFSRIFGFEMNLGGGYRLDELEWNIASDASGNRIPNVLSELKWDNIQTLQVTGKSTLSILDRGFLEMKGSYGEIIDGEVTDSDFLFDDRNGEILRSIAENDGDDVWDLSMAGGIQFDLVTATDFFNADEISLLLLAGHSIHEQNFLMTNGKTTVNEFGTGTGEFPGLRSKYETEWKGPWVGFEFQGARDRLKTYLRFEIHFVDFEAVADWNLRQDFQHPKSFIHKGDGVGLTFGLGLTYQLTDYLGVNLDGTYTDWEITDGKDKTFFANGEVVELRLNEVDWRSAGISVGLTYHF